MAANNLNYSSIYFSIAPRSYSTQSLNQGGNIYEVFGTGETGLHLHSVNTPMNIQVLWNATGLGQDQEGTGANGERVPGDLVNVVFEVWEGTSKVDSTTTNSTVDNFNLVCKIKKTRDVPYKYNGRPVDKRILMGHRFTIDIAPILADLLSYSLTPVGNWNLGRL